MLKLINNKNRKSFKIHFLLAQDTKESNIYIIYYLHWHFKNPLHKKVLQIKSNKHKTWWNYNQNKFDSHTIAIPSKWFSLNNAIIFKPMQSHGTTNNGNNNAIRNKGKNLSNLLFLNLAIICLRFFL